MQPNGQDPNGSPIEYPTVNYRGAKLTVKFSNRSLYRLDKQGIDLMSFGEKLKAGRISVSMIFDILAACIYPAAFSAEDLCEEVPMAEATHAVLDAIKKVQPPAALKLQEPAATSELQ